MLCLCLIRHLISGSILLHLLHNFHSRSWLLIWPIRGHSLLCLGILTLSPTWTNVLILYLQPFPPLSTRGSGSLESPWSWWVLPLPGFFLEGFFLPILNFPLSDWRTNSRSSPQPSFPPLSSPNIGSVFIVAILWKVWKCESLPKSSNMMHYPFIPCFAVLVWSFVLTLKPPPVLVA